MMHAREITHESLLGKPSFIAIENYA